MNIKSGRVKGCCQTSYQNNLLISRAFWILELGTWNEAKCSHDTYYGLDNASPHYLSYASHEPYKVITIIPFHR